MLEHGAAVFADQYSDAGGACIGERGENCIEGGSHWVLRGLSAGCRNDEEDRERRKHAQQDFAEHATASRRRISSARGRSLSEYEKALIFRGHSDPPADGCVCSCFPGHLTLRLEAG